MKYNQYIFAFGLAVTLSMSGCQESILELTPPSTLTEADFYKTSADMDAAVIGIYSRYQARKPKDWTLTEMPTDNIHRTGYFNIGGLDEINTLSFSPENPLFSSFWVNTYNAIFRANAVLTHIETPTDYAAGKKEQFAGEAKFLRALFYFDLVRMFGGVPNVTSILTVEESRQTGRASEEEIYTLIISDLKEAVGLLPSRNAIAKGRASKSAAIALLAKVYVYRQNWNEAKTYLDMLDTDGFALQESYASLWEEATENNNEVIFALKYLGSTNGQDLSTDFLPYFGVAGIAARGNENAFPSWSLMKQFDPADSRKEATFTEYWKSPTSPPEAVENWYPYVSKFANEHVAGSSGLDIPVIRYADILLLKAEVLYRLNQPAEALTALNKIRERAFGNNGHNYTASDIATEESFTDKLLLERQLEFALEGERWFDLVRTGRFTTVLREIEWSYNPVTQTAQVVKFNIEPHMKYFPIPLSQIDLSTDGALKQNDGY